MLAGLVDLALNVQLTFFSLLVQMLRHLHCMIAGTQ